MTVHLRRLLVGNVAHHGGNLMHAREIAGLDAALAGDDLIAAVFWANDDGLKQTEAADGVGEFVERFFVERGARLVGIGVEAGERDLQQGVRLGDGAAGDGWLVGKLARRKQRRQPFVGWFGLRHVWLLAVSP